MARRSRSRAQGYVEFGLGLAVVALVAMVGLDQLRGAIYAYFTGEATHNLSNPPSPLPPPPPPDDTLINLTCPTGPVDLGNPLTCTIKVIDTTDGSKTPTGSILAFIDTVGGNTGDATITPGCTLGPPYPAGQCDIIYTPTHSGLPDLAPYALHKHTLGFNYLPTGPFKTATPAAVSIPVKRNAEVTLNTSWFNSGLPPDCTTQVLVVGFVTVTHCTGYAKEFAETATGAIPPLGTLTWAVAGGSATPTTCTLQPLMGEPSASFCAIDITTTILGNHLIGQVMYDPSDGLHSGPFGLSHGVAGTQPIWLLEATGTDVTGCTSYSTPVNGTVQCTVRVSNVSTPSRAPTGRVVWTAAAGTFQDALVPGSAGAGGCTLRTVAGEQVCTVIYTAPNVPNTSPGYALVATYANPVDNFVTSLNTGTPVNIIVN